MRIGSAIFLIALGAILAWAVTPGLIPNVDQTLVGYILMAVGVIGLIASLVMANPGAAASASPVRWWTPIPASGSPATKAATAASSADRTSIGMGPAVNLQLKYRTAGPDLRVRPGVLVSCWFFIDKAT